MEFYPQLSVAQQKARLPQEFRSNYEKTILDQVVIDGNIIRGYIEYSFLMEKSYFEQPTRSLNGSIENINDHNVLFTPRLVIKYNMMGIEDYRKLMLLLQSKNEFTVTCYNVVLDKRVTHKMYAAPTTMPIIYQRYLEVLGVQEFNIELIGTNNDAKQHTITYNFNIPSGFSWNFAKSAYQSFEHSSMGIVGQNANYLDGDYSYNLADSHTSDLLDNIYTLDSWNTKQDGSGFTYINGEPYFMQYHQTLYAQWRLAND